MTAIYNLHNHTPFSDGAYTIDELCEAHLDADFDVVGIGIADHLFYTPSSREVKNDREFSKLFGPETRSYVREVHEARQRWDGKLRILCGAEINWPLNKNYLHLIKDMLGGIDYVMFEYVDWAGLTQLANQARRWPVPVGLAHTDVAVAFPNTSIDQVVRTMANARIFHELSAKFTPLDRHDRWYSTVPNHRVRVTVGTDTHDDLGIINMLPMLYEYLEGHGLQEKMLVPEIRSEETVNA